MSFKRQVLSPVRGRAKSRFEVNKVHCQVSSKNWYCRKKLATDFQNCAITDTEADTKYTQMAKNSHLQNGQMNKKLKHVNIRGKIKKRTDIYLATGFQNCAKKIREQIRNMLLAWLQNLR